MESLQLPLKDFLMENLYKNYRVVRMANKAKRFIKELFEVYLANPQALPREANLRIRRNEDTRRVICDYIAGMTDRHALDEYKKLFDPYEKV
jgi:dGTPase